MAIHLPAILILIITTKIILCQVLFYKHKIKRSSFITKQSTLCQAQFSNAVRIISRKPLPCHYCFAVCYQHTSLFFTYAYMIRFSI
ncbi:hypothetical protein MBAV_000470 [Candidatus Magnetobacterium bavaricum]|uniref:Uncharacterized protein n=1 Tax=Candidatus Magnetobacterium bavaricum TaxID=29290 RepID=A0A0F3GZK1_9BACT|nr:hypothetical protein MBAV_000470 [Candidatus Magnetobacterium bavaricum]